MTDDANARLRAMLAITLWRILFYGWLWWPVALIPPYVYVARWAEHAGGTIPVLPWPVFTAIAVYLVVSRHRWMDAGPDTARYGWVEHRAGIPWCEAPPPLRWHWCVAWSRHEGLAADERCRCGAYRAWTAFRTGPWREKNSRWEGWPVPTGEGES